MFRAGGAFLLHFYPTYSAGRSAISFFAAGVVALLVWSLSAPARRGPVKASGLGAVLTCAIAFVAGFFGPIRFALGANQEPMLGFLLGPLGFLVGGLG